MKWLGEWTRRIRMLVHRRQFDADLEEEMRLHLELRQQEQMESGIPAEEARAAARRRFGNATYLKEESHIAWGLEWLENLARDVRYGVRALLRERAVFDGGDSMGGAACRFVTPAYFRTLQISLTDGRFIIDDDREDRQRVAVVNETLAKRFWPNESTIGKHFALGNQYSERIGSSSPSSAPASPATPEARWITIVGVFHDTRQVSEWGTNTLPEIYLPYAQATTPLRSVRLVVRSLRSPAEVLESVRQAVTHLDSSLPLGYSEAMEEVVREAYDTERLALVLLTIFAIVALILAVAGVYALLSYNVAQQTREIGIRMALGAVPHQVLAYVLQSGARLALLGVTVGITSAVLLTRLMTRLLYQVSASDPLIFAGAAFVLFAFALSACYIPARRATRVDPMAALKCE